MTHALFRVTAGLAMTAMSLAIPVPAPAAAPAAPADFATSFESTDPPLTWISTAERESGVDGNSTTGIPGNVMDKVVEVTANGENPEAGEVAANVADGDVSSKWLVFEPTGWLRFKLSTPIAIVHYALSSANDAAERDPRDWTLAGSTDGTTWTTVDTRTDQVFEQRFQTKEYRFANATPYLYYRLDITRIGSGSIVQLAEVQLSNGDTTPPPPSDMKSLIGKGPASSPTAKSGVGYTGLAALGYSGRHLTAGRAYSYNKVLEVDIPVTPTTQLSYLIFPEFTPNDLNYPATYAAVDLAFADGGYLSDLGAVDQHGVTLSPKGQGASKTLSTMQWNHKKSTIGAVAAGRTIRRILVAYDASNGRTVFRGWVDDIRITAAPAAPTRTRPSDWVLTTRGTHSTGGFSRGNNFPATAVPHGFNFWTPVTNAGSTSWLYEYHRMNNAGNRPTLQAFSLSHEPSPWMGDRQTFQVMPSVAPGVPDAGRAARALAFGHERETARPHYYGVTFDNGLRTELAPTDHAALFRFTFPGPEASLVFDNVNNNAGLAIDAAAGVVTGHSDVRSGLSTGATRMFVYATFDRPMTASGMLPQGNRPATGYARFDGSTVHMRVATSLISVAQAKHNLELEIAGGDTLESVRARAQAAWDAKLGIIEVEGATEDQLTTLYSNLYRLFLYPNSGYENTGSAAHPIYRHAVQSATTTVADPPVTDGKVYVNNGFWDTYRTTWPAYSLLTPTMAGELVDGFVQQARDGGWVARWSSPGYANLMVGTSSDVAFADAYLKGVRGFDAKAAYEAAVKNASVAPPNQNVGRKGFAQSVFLGYTPTGSTAEAMSWAMDGYINDFGIANMAKALFEQTGERRYQAEHEYFLNRAQNYVHMFDPSVGFFQGRAADGSWRLPPASFDPRVWGFDYTETDGWNMAFHVPQDGQGLANLYGGRDRLASKLDEFFSTPETAGFPGSYGGIIHEMLEARDVRMGQYGHSNQPAHHIIYMYNYAGQPAKTQAKVREALSRLYLGSEIGQGYLGDEDNGEMSAWQVFGALGFYPLQMGSPQYAIGSPLFTKATVHMENGAKLVINAPKNSARNVYVQGLKLNGKRYDRTYLPHDLLARGAVLDFDMGPEPSRWGTAADAAPPSITTGPQVARPLRDITSGAGNPLFDNTSGTQAYLDGGTIELNGSHDKVTHYTLTSGTGVRTTLPGAIPVKGVTASAENPPGEVARNLVDGDPNTKWLAFSRTGSVRFELAEPAAVVRYALTSANDAPTRDPMDWTLQGSDDGVTWTTVDTRTSQVFTERFQVKDYQFSNGTGYRFYRLDITRNAGAALLQLADVQLSTVAGGDLTTGDPSSWTLTGSYDGRTWTVIDERTAEVFPHQLQTRPFAVARPGRYAYYRLDITRRSGGTVLAVAEVELLAGPRPACTRTITTRHDGPLAIGDGVTCVESGATINGPVVIRAGAELRATGGTIVGPLSAAGTAAVVLDGTVVRGPVTITGTTGELSIETARIDGPVALASNATSAAAIIAASTIGGPLACFGNDPAPTDNGLPNTISGPAAGQCTGLAARVEPGANSGRRATARADPVRAG